MSFVFTQYKNEWKNNKIIFSVNKKEFHKSKQPINLIDLINVDRIVVSDKFKHSDGSCEYFIGYKEDKIV